MAEVGERIGHFLLLEQIGAGGMGVVFRARDERVDRDVALKLIPPHLLNDETARKRFHQEARTLSRLSHPNIAALFEFDTHQGQEYLVMELVSGAPLRTRLAGGPLPQKDFQSLAMQLMTGLSAAHAVGIVHRDLKPENIIVSAEGHLKILDFGLAKFTPAAVASAATTGTAFSELGGVVGTVPYMAPEQLRGEAVDPRSDLYSAGVVLYEMAAGRHPFQERGVLLVDAILNVAPAPPSRVNPQAPPGLDGIILKALAKSPAHRYQSAKELAVDLERLSLGLTSGLAPAVPRASHRWMGILIPVAVAVIAVVVWLGTRRETPLRVELVQLTNLTDAALSPALSPDGHMLAYVSGQNISLAASSTPGQVWVQILPNGKPVQLTHDSPNKNWPTFSPDGSRIAYTVTDQKFVWDTWEVPVLGGEPQRMLPNASGLSWIAPDKLLYSKLKRGVHMGIVASSASRTDEREVYFPGDEAGMAHRSALSPDGKWILLVEMDGVGWLPCRLVPFDGSSAGNAVSPPDATCTAAEWSADGRWMYFSSEAGGASHLWRRRFPNGPLEQLTSGATEEDGIGMAPDGRSLVTAVGLRRSEVWLHDRNGERRISSEAYAFLPLLSPDARTVYYLVRAGSSRAYVSGELWRADAATGHAEPMLPGVLMTHYALSQDGRRFLYTTTGDAGKPGLWIADVDHRNPPRQLTSDGEFRAFFGAPGEIIYMSATTPRHLFRIHEDGTSRELISPDPILHLQTVAPGGAWAIVNVPVGHGEEVSVLKAIPLRGGGPGVMVCDYCVAGFGPARIGAPPLLFSHDGKFLYAALRYFGTHSNRTAVIPFSGKPQNLTPRGPREEKDFAALPGVRVIDQSNVFPGLDPQTYVYSRSSNSTNIYRVVLPQ